MIINELVQACHENSKSKGFWDEDTVVFYQGSDHEVTIPMKPWNFGEKIALMHSELSEALEKHRKTLGKGLPDAPDEHCPEFGGIVVEFADTIIRVMDLCGKMQLDLGGAIEAKMKFNATRPVKHGKAY